MNNPFTVEESSLDDDDLVELSVRVVKKLENMSDEEYAGLVLEAAE